MGHVSHMSTSEHLKCGWCKLRGAIHVKYAVDFEDLAQKKNVK